MHLTLGLWLGLASKQEFLVVNICCWHFQICFCFAKITKPLIFFFSWNKHWTNGEPTFFTTNKWESQEMLVSLQESQAVSKKVNVKLFIPQLSTVRFQTGFGNVFTDFDQKKHLRPVKPSWLNFNQIQTQWNGFFFTEKFPTTSIHNDTYP